MNCDPFVSTSSNINAVYMWLKWKTFPVNQQNSTKWFHMSDDSHFVNIFEWYREWNATSCLPKEKKIIDKKIDQNSNTQFLFLLWYFTLIKLKTFKNNTILTEYSVKIKTGSDTLFDYEYGLKPWLFSSRCRHLESFYPCLCAQSAELTWRCW